MSPRRHWFPRLVTAGWFCLASLVGWAGSGGAEFLVTVLKPDDGVPSNVVSDFAQGADGYLWVTSDQNLARFDGLRFVDVGTDRLGEPERSGLIRRVGRVFDGPSGAVWLTTAAGDLWRWNGAEFQPWFQAGTVAASFAKVLELPTDEVLAVSRSGGLVRGGPDHPVRLAVTVPRGRPIPETFCRDATGRIWFLTDQGSALRLNLPSTGTTAVADEVATAVQALASDSAGNIWLGDAGGLSVGRGDRFERVPPPIPGEAFPVRVVLPGPGGMVWVSSQRKAWLWHEGRWQGPAGEWPDQIPPSAQLVDSVGRLWIAPTTQGLWCVRPDGATTRLGPEEGITADTLVLFGDREGDVWASVYRTGLARIRDRRFTPVRVSAGLASTPLWNIGQDAFGAIWLAPEFKGPVRWWEGEAAEIPVLSGNPEPFRWTKALGIDRSGRVWAPAMGVGVLRFEDGTFHPELPWPPGAGFSRVLYQDRGDRWWLGSDSGLNCWTDGRWQSWGAAEGLPSKPIRAIAEDAAGALWVATFGGGLARLDGGRFTVFTRKDGLASDAVYTLCPGADGSLWIGTQAGLARRKDARFRHYTMAQGLPDNRVVQILEDQLGSLWLGTRNGLCRVAIASVDALDHRRTRALECVVFDRSDGLPTRVFQDRSSPACWRARDGRLWFLTAGAAVYCQPERIILDRVAPQAMLETVILDGQAWTPPAEPEPAGPVAEVLSTLAVRTPRQVTLSAGSHLVEIHYTAPCLAVAEEVRFQHRLDGRDLRWVEAGLQRSVFYNLVSPGAYRFRVRAAHSDGRWGRGSAELAVVVEPFIWQTRWFPSAVAMVLVSLIGGAGAWLQRRRSRRQMARLELQRAREMERTRISRDLHDHLGASLTEVGMLAADGVEVSPAQSPPARHFRTIAERVHVMVHELDALVWAVDPRKDSLPDLASYLGSFVEEFAAASGLACRLEIQRGLPSWPLNSEARHNVFLAVKEAAHNAVRHAHASLLVFRFALRERALEVTLEDNGCGFDPGTARAGHGLVNLRERLAGLGGQCEIVARPGHGTGVRLLLTLPAPNTP